MKTCPECGAKISDRAKVCPHCGAKKGLNPAIIVLVLVLASVVFFGSALGIL